MLRIRTGSGSSTLAHPWKIFVVVFAGLVHDGRAGDGEVQALQVRPVAREPQPRTVLQEVQERHHHPVPLRQQPHWRVHQLAQGKKDTITQVPLRQQPHRRVHQLAQGKQCFGSVFIEPGSGSSQKSPSGSRRPLNPDPKRWRLRRIVPSVAEPAPLLVAPVLPSLAAAVPTPASALNFLNNLLIKFSPLLKYKYKKVRSFKHVKKLIYAKMIYFN